MDKLGLLRIRNQTIRQLVYDQLKSKIISAEIAPGQVINLRSLASELGVSIIPIREALWQLESEKAIIIEQNRNIRVNSLSPEEMKEVLRIRLVLETMAARRSCERRPETAVREVNALLAEMKKLINHPKEYLSKNSQFHFAIYRYADSSILMQLIQLLWTRIGPYLSLIVAKGGDFSFSMQSHQAMAEAFAEKNKTALEKALRQDLELAANFIIPFLRDASN